MKKLVITIILSSIALTGSVFAHDCDIVSGESNKIIDSIVTTYGKNTTIANPISTNSKILIKYTNVVPTEAFRQALINLKAYCCSQILSCTKAEKNNLPTKYPASAYLFDHLIDITMRRLDGIPSLAYGLKSVDPTALIRRNKITEIANSVPPNTPQAKEIEALYKNYWTLHEGETKNLYTVIEKYNDYNGEIPIISLADKYNTLCEITKMIYEQTKLNSNISIGGYADKNSFFNGCRNLVKERAKRENGYVQILMVQKSNQLLNETTKAYTKKHFVEEKLMALRNLITKVKSLFQTIVQQAPVSQSCSK